MKRIVRWVSVCLIVFSGVAAGANLQAQETAPETESEDSQSDGEETREEEPGEEEGEREGDGESADSVEGADGEAVPSFQTIMDKVDDLYRSDSSHSTMKMTVQKPRGTRTLTMEAWSKGEERMLVVIREPAREAGTATLRTPKGLWNYLPRADRLMRIPSGLLSESWMGSHFSNDDLMRETNYDEDYTGEVERAEFDGEEAYKVILKPKPDAPVVYSELVFYVTRESWIPLETRYFDDGEVVRTMTYSEVETIGGKEIPTELTLVPEEADGEEMTRLTYEELEFDVDVSDKMFSRRGLRRRAR